MTADLNAHRCVFCPNLLAEGDKIACPEHRARIDAEPMPWSERVLIYGSRTWTDPEPIRAYVTALAVDAVVITGGAQGADWIAWESARDLGLKQQVFPAMWATDGKAAGPIRNQRMIDEGKPTRAHGFRMPGNSPGTDDMTRRLEATGISYEVTTP